MGRASYFSCKQPCANCPYRKDAPLQHWSVDEFSDLLKNDKSQMGAVYMCHKKNGTGCVGFLINQRERNYPSILLRMKLTRENVTAEYLESLHCHVPMFDSIEEMAAANYDDL